MKKKSVIITLSLSTIFLFTACTNSDIVGKRSIDSFQNVLKVMSKQVSADKEINGWSLTSPDGTERFLWSKDFSADTSNDIMLEVDAKPFIEAGLDKSKLPSDMVEGNKIRISDNLGNEKINNNDDTTPLDSYKKIVELKRDLIKYHADLDHYGITIGDGNMFEWAKDIDNNDKDIVFVLDPKQFIDAGVDPSKVDGWLFAKVKIMQENGKKVEVDKLLKPFNLK
ncbi:hypothetical protein [Anaerosacchariphilus polymeriproducens]|uniref:Lipoprotein n=1 Tax=Anaerosacchariphilus polymeriproducens TaxID=1812858 RepID=A0A371AR14_9FIRM|nr:hypothetical protein [Anaerosacchariphilus polymeriproducens]RDU22013.1 hypothetical protein DWV06_15890 [Anaerosacchariphilus polymeriproducens]